MAWDAPAWSCENTVSRRSDAVGSPGDAEMPWETRGAVVCVGCETKRCGSGVASDGATAERRSHQEASSTHLLHRDACATSSCPTTAWWRHLSRHPATSASNRNQESPVTAPPSPHPKTRESEWETKKGCTRRKENKTPWNLAKDLFPDITA